MIRTRTESSSGSRRATKPSAISGAVAMAAVLTCGGPAAAQAEPGVEVALAALEHVRESLPAGRVVLDPRTLCRATIAGWACPEPVAERVRAMGLELGSREFSFVCERRSRDCRIVGTDVLVQPAEPRIMRSTARIVVNVWWSTGNEERPVGSRRSELHLQRDGGTWRVVRERMGGSVGEGPDGQMDDQSSRAVVDHRGDG